MPAIEPVDVIWGNADVIDGDPAVEICSAAVYRPCRPGSFFGDDPLWGLYRPDGSLIDAAAYRRGADHALVGQSPSLEVDASSLAVVDEPLIYGGPMIPHYGHFLTASLPRLWRGRHEDGCERRILYHGQHNIGLWFEMDFSRTILAALGLRPEHFLRLTEPSLVRDLVVPSPAMEELNFAHVTLDRLAASVGRALDVRSHPRDGGQLFISKSRLPHGIARFEQELVLQQRLASRGFDVLHPQELSFADQVQAMARASVIVGATGSSFHTCLFLDRPTRIRALSPTNAIASNFLLIDKLKGNDAHYFHPTTPAAPRLQEDGFHAIWSVADMAAVADELADHALG